MYVQKHACNHVRMYARTYVRAYLHERIERVMRSIRAKPAGCCRAQMGMSACGWRSDIPAHHQAQKKGLKGLSLRREGQKARTLVCKASVRLGLCRGTINPTLTISRDGTISQNLLTVSFPRPSPSLGCLAAPRPPCFPGGLRPLDPRQNCVEHETSRVVRSENSEQFQGFQIRK